MNKIEKFLGEKLEKFILSLFGSSKNRVQSKYIPELGDRVRFVGTHYKYGESAYYGFEGVVDQVGDDYISINSGTGILVCSFLKSRHTRFQRVEDQVRG